MAFARMEATDVNQVVTVRALAIGFRLGAQGGDIEGIVDGFQLCRAQGKLFPPDLAPPRRKPSPRCDPDKFA